MMANSGLRCAERTAALTLWVVATLQLCGGVHLVVELSLEV